ncbi:PIG-P-domain-containing protein [Crepidotus variabilis]|uniref:PIG-P-domain-containing protein n=1 Tax=Crepidotus variabilis TaxID=179855 RepID=A0A9P6EJE3_9AGAR|nr:PIG-P-domain-containing protein [Crepidotus variabilis]
MDNTPSNLQLDTSPRSSTAPIPWPPQSEERRSRASEFYGFVAWTSTYLLFVLYVLWAVLPDEWIRRTGVTWYPNREWALLVPAWSIVVVISTYIAYSAIALRATPAFHEMSSVADSRVALPSEDDTLRNPYFKSAHRNSIPELYDIPIGVVNSVLYHDTLHSAAIKRKASQKPPG